MSISTSKIHGNDMNMAFSIAVRHLLSRKRQSLVSLSGIVIGVAFFLAISSLMQGSQNDFITRLVDNSPHITVSDEYRTPKIQPVFALYPEKRAAIELRSVKPQTEVRGIRNARQILEGMSEVSGVRASSVLSGQAILSFAGQDVNITLNGMVPQEIRGITTIDEHMVEGDVDDLITNRSGIIIGKALKDKLSLEMGDNITLVTATGQVRIFKIVGIFRTGRSSYDEQHVYVDLKRAQALMNRPDRINSIIVKLDKPNTALEFSHVLESRIGYKSVSWQEASEDLMNTLAIRNTIMYSVVSAVLIVAAFGIYNIISTVVMEKHRDIAILKSMGFTGRDILRIFLIQGGVLGLAGLAAGLPLGCGIMFGLMQIRFKPPGFSDPVQMPIDWGAAQFILASAFALAAALLASYLPARKAAQVLPVDILRGGAQ